MEYDVTIDRENYVGGSDIPIIMGLSPFMTRYQLLLIKAGIEENAFTGNKYTVYGQQMEPKIRKYINGILDFQRKPLFEPNRVIKGNIRAHTDGFNGEAVLEIKTTSHIYETVDEYKIYLVQLLKYMEINNVTQGLLAVYERPEDFETEFYSNRLRRYPVQMEKYTDLLTEINCEINRFLADLERLKENPLLSEEDFQPNEIVTLSKDVVALETQLAEMKALEKRCKDAKAELYKAMERHGVKTWQTPNGTRITLVAASEGKETTVEEFNLELFKNEHEELYKQYLQEVPKKTAPKAGYVKITLPK